MCFLYNIEYIQPPPPALMIVLYHTQSVEEEHGHHKASSVESFAKIMAYTLGSTRLYVLFSSVLSCLKVFTQILHALYRN